MPAFITGFVKFCIGFKCDIKSDLQTLQYNIVCGSGLSVNFSLNDIFSISII
jgi:hypothetical protein